MFENVQNVLPVPELTAVAVDYSRADEGFIADQIAPIIPVNKESFLYGKWGREALTSVDRVKRAIGEPANMVSKPTVVWTKGTVDHNALKDSIPDEILDNAPNADLYKAHRIHSVVRKLRVGIEKRVHDLVDATSNTAAAAAVWSTISTGTVEKDILAAKEAMRLALGVQPNVMIVPVAVANALFLNASIKDWVKYTGGIGWLQNGVIPDMFLGLKVIVPGVIQDTRAPGAATAVISSIWGEKEVWFLYVDPGSDVQTMTALLQFRNTVEAVPFAVKQWRDPDLSTNQAWISSEVAQTEINVTPEAVYKLTAVIA